MMNVPLILLIILAVAAALFFTQWQGNHYHAFMKTAARAEGTVLSAQEEMVNPKTRRAEFVVKYAYADATGARHEGQEHVEYADMEELFAAGNAVSVLYDPANPSRSHVEAVLQRRIEVAAAVKARH